MTGLRPNSSWADFKASSDFDPVYWSTIESSGGANAEGIIADLEQTNGRGIGYLLQNSYSGTFISALADYDSASAGKTLTLTATDVYSPNGTVASVAFYAGTGTSGTLLGTATSADDNGNWTIDVAPSSLGGETTVTMVVTDSEGVTNGSSGTTFSISPVSLGQITVDTGDGSGPTTTPVYTSGTSVSISVASVLTTNSGATIAGVKFYLDTSGTGIYNPATVQLLTGSMASNSTGGFTLSGVSTSGWIGNETVFAVATDSSGATNCPVQFVLVADKARSFKSIEDLENHLKLSDAAKTLLEAALKAGVTIKEGDFAGGAAYDPDTKTIIIDPSTTDSLDDATEGLLFELLRWKHRDQQKALDDKAAAGKITKELYVHDCLQLTLDLEAEALAIAKAAVGANEWGKDALSSGGLSTVAPNVDAYEKTPDGQDHVKQAEDRYAALRKGN